MPTKKVINIPTAKKPSRAEVQEAIEIQNPNKSALAPQGKTYKEVAALANSAAHELSGSDVWAKPEQLFRQSYQGGIETLPFYVLRAWEYASGQGIGDRMGVKLMFSNGKEYSVGFPYNLEDPLRSSLLEYFNRSTVPLGPMVIVKRPNKKGNDYYQFVADDLSESRQNNDEPELPW